jgi:putative transposase
MTLATWALGEVGVEAVAESHRPRPYKWPVTVTGGYRRGHVFVSALHVPSAFVTKYRCGVLRSEHLDLVKAGFATSCSDFGATLVESNGQDDHVHLLVEYPPTVAISTLVNSPKDVSSRRQP